jgi:hypothetical protein
MGSVLVIANVSIGRAELTAALDARASSGTSIHVLSPVTPSSSWAAVATLGDPGSGSVPSGVAITENTEQAMHDAEERVRTELRRLRALGATATGEVALSDPYEAAVRAFEQSHYDEIIVSTLPSSVSRWLRMDLSSRLRRRAKVPVVEIIAS